MMEVAQAIRGGTTDQIKPQLVPLNADQRLPQTTHHSPPSKRCGDAPDALHATNLPKLHAKVIATCHPAALANHKAH